MKHVTVIMPKGYPRRGKVLRINTNTFDDNKGLGKPESRAVTIDPVITNTSPDGAVGHGCIHIAVLFITATILYLLF